MPTDASGERADTINRDYDDYIRCRNAEHAAHRLTCIFSYKREVDSLLRDTVRSQLWVFPSDPLTDPTSEEMRQRATEEASAEEASAEEASAETTKQARGFNHQDQDMADAAWVQSMTRARGVYQKDWQGWPHIRLRSAADYICVIAIRECRKALAAAKKPEARLRDWFTDALPDRRFDQYAIQVGENPHNRKPIVESRVALAKWQRRESLEGRSRVEMFLRDPVRVCNEANLDLKTPRSKADMISLVETVLEWCGTAIATKSLFTYGVRPLCRPSIFSLRTISVQRQVLDRMTAERLTMLLQSGEFEAARLSYLEGLSREKAADRLGITVKKFDNQVKREKRRLVDKFKT